MWEHEPEPPTDEVRRLIAAAFEGLATRNHYELLDVDHDAGAAVIRNAFARWNRLVHPEYGSAAELTDIQYERERVHERLVLAFRTLNDPVERAVYDLRLRVRSSAGSGASGERVTRSTPPAATTPSLPADVPGAPQPGAHTPASHPTTPMPVAWLAYRANPVWEQPAASLIATDFEADHDRGIEHPPSVRSLASSRPQPARSIVSPPPQPERNRPDRSAERAAAAHTPAARVPTAPTQAARPSTPAQEAADGNQPASTRDALAQSWLEAAETRYRAGQYWEALCAAEQAVSGLTGRSRTKALLLLARAQLQNPKWARRAETTLLKLTHEQPESADAYALLAEVYAAEGLSARAAAMWRRVLQIDPHHATARAELANATRRAPDDEQPLRVLGRE